MKIVKKLLVLFLTLTMVLPMATACGGNNCNHDNVIICDTCGEIVVGEEYFSNMAKSALNTLGKGKSTKNEMQGSLEMDSPSIAVEYEAVNGDYKEIAVSKIKANFSADLTSGFTSTGEIIASGSAIFSAEQIQPNGNVAQKIVYEIKNIGINNLVFSCTLKNEITFPTLTEQEQAINNVSREETQSINIANTEGGDTAVSVLTDMLPRVLSAYQDPILPYINGIIDANKKDVNKVLAKGFDSTCTLTKENGNNVFKVTKIGTSIKEIPSLLETKVNVLVDNLLGEGTYDKLPQKIEQILNTKLSKILSDLEKKGIKVDELADVIDEVIQIVMNDKNATLENLAGFDIVGFIDNLDKEKTVKEILINFGAFTSEQQITEMLASLEETLNEYKDKTLYDILNILFKVNIGAEQKEAINEAAIVLGNFVDKILNAKVVADNKGNIVYVEYGVSLNGNDNESKALITWLKDNINFPSYGNGIVSQEEQEFNSIMDMLSSVKASVSYKTTIVNS